MDLQCRPENLVRESIGFFLCVLCAFVVHLLLHRGVGGKGKNSTGKIRRRRNRSGAHSMGGGRGDEMERERRTAVLRERPGGGAPGRGRDGGGTAGGDGGGGEGAPHDPDGAGAVAPRAHA